MTRAQFLDVVRAARPADLDALRLDVGYTTGGARPALLLRGSTWDGRPSVVVCTTTPRDRLTPAEAFARLDGYRANSFGRWLREWIHEEKVRRFQLARITGGAG